MGSWHVIIMWICVSLYSQGINSMDTHKVGVTIPINQIPFVMRAIGFYPSEQEVCMYI